MPLPTSPDYVADKVSTPDVNGPAQFPLMGNGVVTASRCLLFMMSAMKVHPYSRSTFRQRTGQGVGSAAVRLASLDGAAAFLVYDPRKHPANLFGLEKFAKLEPRFAEPMSSNNVRENYSALL